MKKRLAAVLFLGLASTLVFTASPAFAHGEKSQEAFLRMRSIGFTDVSFTGGRVQNGEILHSFPTRRSSDLDRKSVV